MRMWLSRFCCLCESFYRIILLQVPEMIRTATVLAWPFLFRSTVASLLKVTKISGALRYHSIFISYALEDTNFQLGSCLFICLYAFLNCSFTDIQPGKVTTSMQRPRVWSSKTNKKQIKKQTGIDLCTLCIWIFMPLNNLQFAMGLGTRVLGGGWVVGWGGLIGYANTNMC